jgi:hypothetical protein
MPKSVDSRAIWTTLDEPGQRAACSTTAGCRFDSCPTCPSQILNSSGLQPHGVQPILACFDPNENNTGSHVIDAKLVIDVLLQHMP